MTIKFVGCNFSGNKIDFLSTARSIVKCNACGHMEKIEAGAYNGAPVCPKCGAKDVEISVG